VLSSSLTASAVEKSRLVVADELVARCVRNCDVVDAAYRLLTRKLEGTNALALRAAVDAKTAKNVMTTALLECIVVLLLANVACGYLDLNKFFREDLSRVFQPQLNARGPTEFTICVETRDVYPVGRAAASSKLQRSLADAD